MERKIILLKQFYSTKDLSEITDTDIETIKTRLKVMEITPDIKINGINHYSESAKNRVFGVYEFEKTPSEIIYHERNRPKEKFETFESKINKVFYQYLGQSCLKPHEDGLLSLFDSIKKDIPGHLKRIDATRKAFIDANPKINKKQNP